MKANSPTTILTLEAVLCMLNSVAVKGSLLDLQKKKEEFIRDFDLHWRAIQRYFIGKGFNLTDAEDLTQETFAQAFQGLKDFRGESRIKTWLYRIAENVYNKAIRRSKALKRDGQETTLENIPSDRIPDYASPLVAEEQDSRFEGHQLRTLLTEERLGLTREALKDLPAKMQRCFLLYIHQERKYHEIAALMDLSINTVKSHIHQARKRLKEAVGDPFDGLGR